MEEPKFEINITTNEDINLVVVRGDIDASTAKSVTDAVLALVVPESKILLDMTKVEYMSSAGLRTLLSIHRQTTAKEGKLLLVGLNEELKDTMDTTGFLVHFVTTENLEAGLKALK
ncbi:STAS domain-containing protein [Aphanizomenon flos-aquae NRERC-008]|jgi:anti-sigma B factor antagonist|uniref:Anti-sigma factor antagonist n=1 Tax=Aphanizomenon flos-aquae FACHB-1249 TaxID=2692889 RepID=A0ABR8IT20_APHFL|nr:MULTISPECIES: STAS domain-containing protein [Aphanizomenon]MDJ0506239.1 STAS domain-containing protein [Nostocales cyanobacterium LE14-WE12]MBD2391623.1 STAS domain-containing protein [Aphanizomenon flos-aquae FACHB-1171]MBD2558072.1 STAS domain-containing protein [Aphanizomenon flos-aquae FACHB-1290]MBD2632598.1 STAS domain-containing protein [Aphanizomenon sp. FACHB-1399]MBD2643474.1 STAS domain-containing protein [Aphanizomenon sp. FACHB-1401]